MQFGKKAAVLGVVGSQRLLVGAQSMMSRLARLGKTPHASISHCFDTPSKERSACCPHFPNEPLHRCISVLSDDPIVSLAKMTPNKKFYLARRAAGIAADARPTTTGFGWLTADVRIIIHTRRAKKIFMP